MAALVIGTGLAIPAPAPQSTLGGPAAAAVPLEDRDDQVSRDDARPALLPNLAGVVNERRESLSNASLQIGVEQRALRVTEFLKQRKAAEKAARYADKVKKLGYDPKTADPRDIAKQIMKTTYNWGADQFKCYDNIIMRESLWKVTADNPTSSAYGIPQALPGSKMASEGADWRTNPATQIKWGLKYVKDRYGTPCGAWGFKSSNGWY